MTCSLISARRLVLIGVLVSVLVVGPWSSSALAAPPFNDNFTGAQLLGGEAGQVASTSHDATKEVGEPAHAGAPGGASVWFQWTADREGSLTVWTNVPSFDTVLAVYTGGAVGALTEVASNDNYGAGMASRVTVPVDAGTTYRIAVDGAGAASGAFRLRWRQGPVNDFFADAAPVEAPSGSVQGVSFGATSEPGEITELSVASTWYRWTAPETGSFGFHVRDAAGLTVYTGSSPGALTAVGETGSEVVFAAAAGTEYSVRVAGYSWDNDYPFTLFWGASPANDAFANPVEIEGSLGAAGGSTAFATLETDEPARGSNSVWYTWTAPTTGYVRFDAFAVEDDTWDWMDTILTVYTGTTLDALAVVARNDDWYRTELPGFGSAVSFRAVAGTTYSISVTTWGSFSWGPFKLRWYPGVIIIGRSGDETFTGTAGRDYIDGARGNDVIHGRGGNDVIVGNAGRDRLYGDGGADLLNSKDRVRGNDQINGGPGRDRAVHDARDHVRNVP
jgi:hypothetical protein